MAYNWQQITPQLITNWFLYGQATTPTDLVNDVQIRPLNDVSTIEIDMSEYMTNGGGRFAFGPKSSLVSNFMTGISFVGETPGVRQVLNRDDLIALYQNSGVNNDENISIQQTNYGDLTDDYALRSYIFNSSSFKISDDAVFVIEADGTRHIENYAIHAFDENFDFDGAGLATIGNNVLEPLINPSYGENGGIGRKVEIEFTNKELVPTGDYTASDYLSDVANLALTFSPLTLTQSLPSDMINLAQDLFSAGVTKFLDNQNRPILYGSSDRDALSENFSLSEAPLLYPYKSNGVVLIAGDGDDVLTGGEHADKLIGGAGYSLYFAGDGDVIEDVNNGVSSEPSEGDVIFNNILLSGGRKSGGVYRDDFNNVYSQSGGDLTITGDTGTLVIQNFRNMDLGIYLDDGPLVIGAESIAPVYDYGPSTIIVRANVMPEKVYGTPVTSRRVIEVTVAPNGTIEYRPTPYRILTEDNGQRYIEGSDGPIDVGTPYIGPDGRPVDGRGVPLPVAIPDSSTGNSPLTDPRTTLRRSQIHHIQTP